LLKVVSPLQAVPVSPTNRYRRAADFTALRLGRAVLGYLAIMVGIITLSPFRFEATPAHGFSLIWDWSDLILNVLMFVPFGFVYQLTRPRGTPTEWWRVLALGVGVSGAIEVAQLFSPTRFSSVLDLGTNTSGALLGAWSFNRLSRRLRGDAAVRVLALELPLMGLVYLLVPLCWLIGLGSEGEMRRLLVLGPALIAGAILGTVHASAVHPVDPAIPGVIPFNRQQIPWWLVFTSLGWSAVALGPGARGDLSVIVPGVFLTMATALLRDIGTRRLMATDASRRVELPTLQFVLPIYAAYLALSALWPLTEATPNWHGALAMAPLTVELSQPLVLRTLEQVAAFTLVGYMGAEYYGRHEARGVPVVLRLALWGATVSALLQLARGFHAQHGASLSLFVLTQIAGLYGQWVYVLQRAHVQALVQRRALLESFRRASSAPRKAA
jgi:glycopeptide antibiotics resistance protein